MADYSIFAERERAGWSNPDIVGAYVAKFGPVVDEVAEELCSRVAAPGRPVLDLCCGQGTLTAMLADAGATVSGLDFSPEMLALAADAAPAATLHLGDAGDMPYSDDSFAAVTCNFGMMHLPDQPRALTEISRVLEPGGRFVMATWAGPDVSPAFATVFGAIRAHVDLSAAPAQPDLFAFARPESAAAMMEDAGLRMTSHETVEPSWRLESPDGLYDIFSTATVAAAMILKRQAPEVIDAIRGQVTSTVAEKFADGDGFRVPVPVAVVTAVPA